MNWFSNLKIGKKLAVAFGVIEILMVGLGVFSLSQLSKVNGSTVEIATNWMPSVAIIGKLQFDAAMVRRFELDYVLARDSAEMDKFQTSLNDYLVTVADDRKKYEPLISSDQERHLYEEFNSSWDKYLAVANQVVQFSKQNKKSEARDLTLGQASSLFTTAVEALHEDLDLNHKGGIEAANDAAATYSSSRYWVIGLLLAAAVVGFVIATGLARSVSTAVNRMSVALGEIAANNLAIADLDVSSEDEIGQAGLALNEMKNNLRELIQSIAGTAEHVASASEEISSSASQQSQSAETQKDQAALHRSSGVRELEQSC